MHMLISYNLIYYENIHYYANVSVRRPTTIQDLVYYHILDLPRGRSAAAEGTRSAPAGEFFSGHACI
jgi:hypothetical protein